MNITLYEYSIPNHIYGMSSEIIEGMTFSIENVIKPL